MIAPDLPELATALKKQKKHITIETAGTILPNSIPCDLASISPKLSNSTPSPERDPAWAKKHEATRLQPEVISEWISKYDFQLKFVVSTENDLAEIKGLLSRLPPVPLNQILLMPEGIDEGQIATRQQELVSLCLQRGNRYCDRLHIRLFGNTKGT